MRGNKEKLFKHQLLIVAISVFGVLTAMISGSFALFSSTSKAGEYNVLKAGNFELSYVDKGTGLGDVLSLNGAYPKSDSEGIKGTPYRFNISNTGTITANYRIKLLYDDSIIQEDECQDKLLPQQYIRYQFNNEEPQTLGDKENVDYVIYTENNMVSGTSKIHEIRIWIADTAPNNVLGKHFHGKLVVESVQSLSSISNSSVSYQIGDSVIAIDGSKWHVLEASNAGEDTVVLLSDFNLNNDGTYNSSCGKGTDSNDPYCSTRAFNLNNTNVYEGSDIKTFIDTVYVPKVKVALPGTTNITLPTAEQIAVADGKTFVGDSDKSLSSDWLLTTNYWTKTKYNDNDVDIWLISGNGRGIGRMYGSFSTGCGARPVITTPKENLILE